MKTKLVTGLMLTLLLAGITLAIIPVRAQTYIRIGAVGPIGLIMHTGVAEGEILAAEEINLAGGVNVGGTYMDIQVGCDTASANIPGSPDTGLWGMETIVPTPDPTASAQEMERLIDVEDADFVIGGFRTECTRAMRDMAVHYAYDLGYDRPIYLIAGSATNDLIYDTPPNPYGDVFTDYAKYKYVFRITPTNSTNLGMNIAFQIRYIITQQLVPAGFSTPISTAILADNLDWVYDTVGGIKYILGLVAPGMISYDYEQYVDSNYADFDPHLASIGGLGCKLIIQVLSGLSGLTFSNQWGAMPAGTKPAAVGINVLAEMSEHWLATSPNPGVEPGRCEFQAFLNTLGTRTNVTVKSWPFWDAYVARFGHAPIYTSYGGYDGVYGIKEAIEAATADGKLSPGVLDHEALIPYFEMTDRVGTPGKFRYTGPNPATDFDPHTGGDQPYPYLADNPTMKGTLHDVWSFLNLATAGMDWPDGYSRPLMTQWRRTVNPSVGEMLVVFPVFKDLSVNYDLLPFVSVYRLPPNMYRVTDINWDGFVNILDVAVAAAAFGSYPGHERWDYTADVAPSWYMINILDVATVAGDFGKPGVP